MDGPLSWSGPVDLRTETLITTTTLTDVFCLRVLFHYHKLVGKRVSFEVFDPQTLNPL